MEGHEREIEFAGDAVAEHLRFADCCENCALCKTDHPIDDPIGYICTAFEPQPPCPDTSECYKWDDDDPRFELDRVYSDWMDRNGVHAGTVCDRFKALSKTRIIQSRQKYRDAVDSMDTGRDANERL